MSWLRLMEENIGRKNKVSSLIREMWPAYLIEIFVIILGISITLALEEWRDNVKENRLERIYLKNLLTDIEQDLQSLKNTSFATQTIIDRGNDLIAHIRNPESKVISFNQFEADVWAILGRPKFLSNDATFSDLKSSGNLHLLKDIQLKNVLFSYYSQVQNIKNDQDAEQQATITLSGSYFIRQFPFIKQFPTNDPGDSTHDIGSKAADRSNARDQSNMWNNLSKNIEFSNNVLLRVTTRKELLDLYQRADSLANRVREELIKSE